METIDTYFKSEQFMVVIDFPPRKYFDKWNADALLEGIQKGFLEAAKKVGEERQAFRQMLAAYVPDAGYSAPERPRILNVGCGRCHEALVLSSYFGGKPGGFESEEVFVMGIDQDEQKIEEAKSQYKKPDFSERVTKYVEKKNYRFIHGDARRLREFVDGEFDVVVARHPNVAELPKTWDTIFREAYGIKKPDGLFLATSFSDVEHELLEALVQRAGYQRVMSTANAFARPTCYKKISIDRNILLARRD